MVVANFTSEKKSAVVLMNRSTSGRSVSLSTSQTYVASVKGGAAEPALAESPDPEPEPGSSLAFHRNLRRFRKTLPGVSIRQAPETSKRASIVADTEGTSQVFRVYISDGYVPQVTATCRLIRSATATSSLIIYVDNSINWADPAVQSYVQQLGSAWASIYATDRAVFGAEPPSGFNGLALGNDVTLLLTNVWNQSYSELAGFFNPADLYPTSTQPNSNQRKMFYLSYNPVRFTQETIISTMAHEFQHMINFHQRKVNGLEEDTWLDEALSGYAEHICGYSINNGKNQSKALQANDFFDSIAATSLTSWQDTHAAYGQAFLFGVWFGQKFGGQGGSLQSLLTTTTTGTGAIAAFTGVAFDRIFAMFRLALYVNDYTDSTSKYGLYNISMTGNYSFPGWADVKLRGPAKFRIQPGEGTGAVTVAAYSSIYVEVTGGTGANLNYAFPSGTTAFEMHK